MKLTALDLKTALIHGTNFLIYKFVSILDSRQSLEQCSGCRRCSTGAREKRGNDNKRTVFDKFPLS